MFDFQKEVILNGNMAALDARVHVNRAKNTITIERCGEYKGEYVVGGISWIKGSAGTKAKATYTLPSEDGQYRLVLGISLDGAYLADYAHPWSKSAKNIVVEFEKTSKTTAANVAKAVKLALPADAEVAKVTTSGSTVIVECMDTRQVIKEAAIYKIEASACGDGCSDVEYVHVSDATTTPNKHEVGTGKWLRENLRFPTSANMGYYALNADEAPELGTIYDQFTFSYTSPRVGLGGVSSLGQALTAVTTHTFYVPQDAASRFADLWGQIKLGDAESTEPVTSSPVD